MPIYFEVQSALHVAIIMDGNGRWALARGLPRVAGHQAGAEAVRRTVKAAPDLGIGVLTLFAFSTDNWRRPPAEVSALMALLSSFLDSETPSLVENGVRLEIIGRRDRLDDTLRNAIARAEMDTSRGTRLRLRVAIDYSGRDAILTAARSLPVLSRASLEGALGPAVDLLIRTGGECRLSDFLLWESAYAELVFSRCMWPDFAGADLAGAVRQFHGRERRFGAVPAVTAQRESAWLD